MYEFTVLHSSSSSGCTTTVLSVRHMFAVLKPLYKSCLSDPKQTIIITVLENSTKMKNVDKGKGSKKLNNYQKKYHIKTKYS